jgi:hypothetical protein
MSWTGRKRSQGDRHPCGKLKSRKPGSPPPQPHRKGFGTNPIAETVHGRYHLGGHINGPQYVAGSLFLRARLRYQAAIGSPHGPRSPSGSPSEGHPTELEPDDAKDIAAYEAARRALGYFATDVEWIVVQDQALYELYNYLKGLDILRRLYRV